MSYRSLLPIAAMGVVTVVALALALNCAVGGLAWNGTASMPRGLWRISKLKERVERGMVVSICPPGGAAVQAIERGYIGSALACPSYAEPLIKVILAVPGDRVRVGAQGIAVNGRLVPDTAAQDRDEAGRPMQPQSAGTYHVAPGFVWIGAERRLSFDSRYFGPVPIANIKGNAEPLWVWP